MVVVAVAAGTEVVVVVVVVVRAVAGLLQLLVCLWVVMTSNPCSKY